MEIDIEESKMVELLSLEMLHCRNGDPTGHNETILVAAEAKGKGSASETIGLPQLVVYMTPAQQVRSEKQNQTVCT